MEAAKECEESWAGRSAELHSAVSPNCIRLTVLELRARPDSRNAMQVANLRYGRVQLCATRSPRIDRARSRLQNPLMSDFGIRNSDFISSPSTIP